MSLMEDITKSHRFLTVPATITGNSSNEVDMQANAIDIREINIKVNNQTGEKSAEVVFVYGNIVNDVFTELPMINGDKETSVTIDKPTFESLAGTPLTPYEKGSNPHEIIYTRIVGYMVAQGVIQ